MKRTFLSFLFLSSIYLNANAKCTCWAYVHVFNQGIETTYYYSNPPSFGGSYQIYPGDSVKLNAFASSSCQEPYYWTLNGDTVLINTDGNFTAYDTGHYSVIVMCDMWYIPFRVNIAYYTETGIENINQQSSLTVYPNPFTNNFSLEIKTAKASRLSYQIYDCTGREIKEVNKENVFGEVKLTEDFEAMSKGIYFLRMQIGEAMFEKKLVRF